MNSYEKNLIEIAHLIPHDNWNQTIVIEKEFIKLTCDLCIKYSPQVARCFSCQVEEVKKKLEEKK